MISDVPTPVPSKLEKMAEEIDAFAKQLKELIRLMKERDGCRNSFFARKYDMLVYNAIDWFHQPEASKIYGCIMKGLPAQAKAYGLAPGKSMDSLTPKAIKALLKIVESMGGNVKAGIVPEITFLPDPFECCICMGDEVGMERVTLPCQHTFHTHCMLKWAASSTIGAKTSATCPCCRAKITTEQILWPGGR